MAVIDSSGWDPELFIDGGKIQIIEIIDLILAQLMTQFV